MSKALEICRKNLKPNRPTSDVDAEYIKRNHSWVIDKTREIEAVFGKPGGIRVFEDGAKVFDWKSKR